MRLNFYYEGDEVFDEYFTYDGQPIYWNASIAETECSPYVYGYLYQELPDGSNGQMGYFYEHFTTECEDWGDVDLHVHNMTYTGTDTNNGTTDLIWNLSDLEVGQEYLSGSRIAHPPRAGGSVYGILGTRSSRTTPRPTGPNTRPARPPTATKELTPPGE